MNYKEIQKECYERLLLELGREPKPYEVSIALDDELGIMINAIMEERRGGFYDPQNSGG